MLKCIVCDDDLKIVEKAQKISKKVFSEENVVVDYSLYTDSRTLFYDLCEGMTADIAILDIEMPEYSGIDIVKRIKVSSPNCIVIFLTSHTKYAVESFEYDIFRYTPKYMMEEKLGGYISSAVKILQKQEGQMLKIPFEKSVERIPFKDILSVIKEGKYIVITDVNGRERRIREAMKDIVDILSPKEFIMVDRGCILNIIYIKRIEKCDAICINGFRFPVSQSRVKQLKQTMLEYWGGVL